MTTGRINQVARDEPTPDHHAQHPDACSRTHPDCPAHAQTTARPAFGFCDPRTNHTPSRMCDTTPDPTSRPPASRAKLLAGGATKTLTQRTSALRERPNHTTTRSRAITRTNSRPRTHTPPRSTHTPHALRQRTYGAPARPAGGASSDHSNERRAQCSPAEAPLTPSAR